MAVRFDARAASAMIERINNSCSQIEMNAVKLIEIIQNISGWDDDQKKAFIVNVQVIVEDLNKVLALEGDYMRMYDQRVKELIG